MTTEFAEQLHFRRSTLPSTVSARRATFTLLDNSSAPSCPAFSAFFHSTHSAFSLRANAEAGTADHDTDTRRSRPGGAYLVRAVGDRLVRAVGDRVPERIGGFLRTQHSSRGRAGVGTGMQVFGA
jgi:hypothetical protein